MLARLLDAGLRDPPTLRWALLGGGPIPPAAARARRGGRGSRRPDLRHDRGVLADRHLRLAPARSRDRASPTARCWSAVPRSPRGRCPTDGWLHTGDLGEFDERGRLRHHRAKAPETIITGGENVAPAEVEAVAAGAPGGRRCRRVRPSDPEWGEAVVGGRRAASMAPRPTPRSSASFCAAAAGRVQGAQDDRASARRAATHGLAESCCAGSSKDSYDRAVATVKRLDEARARTTPRTAATRTI